VNRRLWPLFMVFLFGTPLAILERVVFDPAGLHARLVAGDWRHVLIAFAELVAVHVVTVLAIYAMSATFVRPKSLEEWQETRAAMPWEAGLLVFGLLATDALTLFV
jgi:hypothetical protein